MFLSTISFYFRYTGWVASLQLSGHCKLWGVYWRKVDSRLWIFFLTPPVNLLDLPFPVHGLLLLSFLRLSNWSSSYHTAHTKIQVLIQKSCSIIHLLYSGDCMKVVCTNGTLKFQKHVPIFCCKCPKIIIPFFTVFFLRLMKYGDGRLIF